MIDISVNLFAKNSKTNNLLTRFNDSQRLQSHGKNYKNNLFLSNPINSIKLQDISNMTNSIYSENEYFSKPINLYDMQGNLNLTKSNCFKTDNKMNNFLKQLIEFECEVCLSIKNFSINEIEALNNNTNVCIECLRVLIFNSMKDFSLMPPKIKKIELSEEILTKILTKNEKDEFDMKREEFFCTDKHYCQNKKCSNFINMDLIPSTQTLYRCLKCGKFNCLVCRTLSHIGIDCYINIENKENSDLDTEKSFKLFGYKKCPKCKMYIELSYGCNHMKCLKCSFEFCFECFTEWKGNYCSKGCKLYNQKMENILLENELNNLHRNRMAVNDQVINGLREQIRNQTECLHEERVYLNLKWRDYIENCDNCGYDLVNYCFRCRICPNFLFCKTCHLYRY